MRAPSPSPWGSALGFAQLLLGRPDEYAHRVGRPGEEEVDAFLHLPAPGRERTCPDRQEANHERFRLSEHLL